MKNSMPSRIPCLIPKLPKVAQPRKDNRTHSTASSISRGASLQKPKAISTTRSSHCCQPRGGTPKKSRSQINSLNYRSPKPSVKNIVSEKSLTIIKSDFSEKITEGNVSGKGEDVQDVIELAKQIPLEWQKLFKKMTADRDSITSELLKKRLPIQAQNFIKITSVCFDQVGPVQRWTEHKVSQLREELSKIVSRSREIEDKQSKLEETNKELNAKLTKLSYRLNSAQTTVKSMNLTHESEKNEIERKYELLAEKHAEEKAEWQKQQKELEVSLENAESEFEKSQAEVQNLINTGSSQANHSKSEVRHFTRMPEIATECCHEELNLITPWFQVPMPALQCSMTQLREENVSLRELANSNSDEEMKKRLQRITKRNRKDAEALTALIKVMKENCKRSRVLTLELSE